MIFLLGMFAACHASNGAKTGNRPKAIPPQTAHNNPPADLPGITTAADLLAFNKPLTAADVQFYLNTMQSAIARYQQPTAGDRQALAQAPLIVSREAQAAKQMAADMKAGKLQEASADVYHDSPAEKAMKDRFAVLTIEGADVLIAGRENMPERQWDALKTAVEMAAHAGPFSVAAGSAGDGGRAVLTQQQIVRAQKQQSIMNENEKFIIPWGKQIRLLASTVMSAQVRDAHISTKSK